MLNTSLALRYARALYQISKLLEVTKKVRDDLHTISECIDSSADLRRVLYHPGITPEEKKQVVNELFSKRCEGITLRGIGFLIDKKRTFYIAAISRCFSALLDDDENRILVKVESMNPLSGEAIKRIKERLIKGLGKDVVITAVVVPSLMGGLRLILGDRVIDGSIAYHLKKLSESVTEF